MIAGLMTTAAEQALGHSLPHRRMEDWRWTDLRQMIDKPYPPRQQVMAAEADIDRLLKSSPFTGIAAARMVFVNGHFDAKRSKLVSSAVEPRAVASEPVQQMNAAFATDGARLKLSGNIDTPVELVFIASDAAPHSTVSSCSMVGVW